MSLRPLLYGAALLIGGGCVINNDAYPRPRDLSEQSIVDKLRILAVRADPPEIAPGETTALSALVVDPAATSGLTVWAWCDGASATDFGCPLDPSAIDPTAGREELFEQGIAGIEPLLPPEVTADPAWLDGLEGRARLEGVNITVQALVLPADLGDGDDQAFDFEQVESGFKRLVVSEAPTPNRNPPIARFTVDGLPIPEDQVVVLDPGQPYELGLELPDEAIETYTYVNLDGVEEQRVEEPYAEWYATDGEVLEFFTLHPFLQSDWISPGEPSEGRWWAVLKDRRGGMTWVSRRWRVR